MESSGPIVPSGEGYREIIAAPTEDLEQRERLNQYARQVQRRTLRLSAQRAAEIEEGLIHQTPAMAGSLAKLGG